MALKVRPSRYLQYTEAELREAEKQCEADFAAKVREAERWAELSRDEQWREYRKRIEEMPLLPTGGREPPRHERIVRHAESGELWIQNHGYMAENLWDDLLSWSREEAERG